MGAWSLVPLGPRGPCGGGNPRGTTSWQFWRVPGGRGSPTLQGRLQGPEKVLRWAEARPGGFSCRGDTWGWAESIRCRGCGRTGGLRHPKTSIRARPPHSAHVWEGEKMGTHRNVDIQDDESHLPPNKQAQRTNTHRAFSKTEDLV